MYVIPFINISNTNTPHNRTSKNTIPLPALVAASDTGCPFATPKVANNA